jgi:hypothetical protein
MIDHNHHAIKLQLELTRGVYMASPRTMLPMSAILTINPTLLQNFFEGLCDVAKVVIIYKVIQSNLATY